MTDQNQQSLLLGKIAAYTEILVKDPGSTIFVLLAETYRKLGMFDDARLIISKGLDLHPDFGPAHIVLARVLCQLEDYNGSIAEFNRALELDEESLAALVGCARVHILLGDEKCARQLLLDARHLSPADPVINKLLLSLPEFADEAAKPVDDLSSQDEASVTDAAMLVSPTLAELYLQQGLTGKALDVYRQLSNQNPDDLDLRRRVKELTRQEQEENRVEASSSATGLSTDGEEAATAYSAVETSSNNVQQSDISGNGIGNESGNLSDHDAVVIETLNCWLANIKQRRGNV